MLNRPCCQTSAARTVGMLGYPGTHMQHRELPSDATTGTRRPAGVRYWVALGFVVAVVLAWFGLGPGAASAFDAVQSNLDVWQDWVSRYPLPAIVIFFLIYACSASLPLPVLTVMSLLAGALFGRQMGTVVASLAYAVGVTTAFLVARSLLRERVQRSAGPWLQRIQRGVERDGCIYLLTLRLMPSVPFFLVNVFMALTSIRTRTYTAVSWAGVLPATYLYAGVGTELATLDSPAGILSLPVLGSLAALAITPLAVRRLVRWCGQFRPL